MADPGAGRRANGLQASDWAALVDLDPRLSEGLLDRLAQAGVAAYVEPATAVDTVHRAVLLPDRPLDRLWVDPGRAERARDVVSDEVAVLTALLSEDEPGATAHGLVQPVPRTGARRVLPPPVLPTRPVAPPVAPVGPADLPPDLPASAGPPGAATPMSDADPPAPPPVPPASAPSAPPPSGTATSADPPSDGRPPKQPAPEPSPLDDDAVFRQIVAGFERETDDPVPRWPPAEDLDRPAQPPRRRRADRPLERPVDRPRADPALPPWVEPAALDRTRDDGHYVPPPPPPVPRVRPRTLAAVAAIVLSLLLLFAPGVVGLTDSPEVAVMGILLLAGGALSLVWWMRDSSSGGDDGAVV